jgi:hypothetical protein
VEVSTDGTTYSVPTTFGGSTWNTGALSLTNGSPYTLKARATDNLGNVSSILDIDSFTVDRTAPSITDVTAPANATYGSGQNLDFVATMSEATTTTGTPRIALTIGSTTQYATYLSGSGTTSLTFRYITQSGDNDTDGIAVTSPVQLNGGTLRDSASNDATLTFTPPTTTGVRVDTIAPTVAFTATAGNYASGQTLGLTATYSEPVTISAGGNPSVPLTLTTGTLTATDTGGAATNVTTRTFTTGTIGASGTHQDIDSTLNVGTVALNSATITDAAGNALTLTPTPATVTGVTINAPATGGTITTTPDGLYRVHTFTTVGTSTFTVTGGTLNVEYLVVGGGGAGGRGDDADAGGGGGGGGRVVVGTITLPLGSTSVTVGNGGTGGTSATDGNSSGGNSQLGSGIIANGGGRGGRVDPSGFSTGGSGGSGGGGFRFANGGGSAAAVTGGSYGYSGGAAGGADLYYVGGGGGGGAGGVGSNGSGINGGNGGAGRLSTIDGSSKYYGGGGGGGFSGTGSAGTGGNGVGGNGGSTGSTSGSAGSINRGGGGGGGSQGGSDCSTLGAGGCGGAGGSGIVIIRYPI